MELHLREMYITTVDSVQVFIPSVEQLIELQHRQMKRKKKKQKVQAAAVISVFAIFFTFFLESLPKYFIGLQ